MKVLGLLGIAFFLALGACGQGEGDLAGTYLVDSEDARAKVERQMDEKLAFMRGQLATMRSVAEMGREEAEDKEAWKPEPEIVEKLQGYEQQIARTAERFEKIRRGYASGPMQHTFQLVLATDGTFTSANRTTTGETTARGTWTFACEELTLVTSQEDGIELDPPSSAALVCRDGVIELQREQDPFPLLLRRQ